MLVIFDLDNTLIDRQAAIAGWADEFVGEHRLSPSAADWIRSADLDGYRARREFIEMIRTNYALDVAADEMLARYERRVVELARLSSGVLECLRLLRSRGAQLAIVTNGSSHQQHAKIERVGLESEVDVVVVSGDVGVKKPDPAIFMAACRALDADPLGSWMVGDSPDNDIVGAVQLGIHTVWLRRGRKWPEPIVQPTFEVDSLSEIPELLSPTT